MKNAKMGAAGPGAAAGELRGGPQGGQAGHGGGGHGGAGHGGAGPGGPGLPGIDGRGGPLPGAEIFSFAITDGLVTSASRTVNATTVTLSDNASGEFALKGDDIVLTRTFTRGQEVIVFSDADADSLYAITARAHIVTAAPPTGTDGVVHAHQLQVILDPATSAVTEVSHVLRDGTVQVIQGTDLSFAINQGLLIATHTDDVGSARWEIFRDGNADGTYTEVAQGAGSVVDLATVLNLTEPNIDLL